MLCNKSDGNFYKTKAILYLNDLHPARWPILSRMMNSMQFEQRIKAGLKLLEKKIANRNTKCHINANPYFKANPWRLIFQLSLVRSLVKRAQRERNSRRIKKNDQNETKAQQKYNSNSLRSSIAMGIMIQKTFPKRVHLLLSFFFSLSLSLYLSLSLPLSCAFFLYLSLSVSLFAVGNKQLKTIARMEPFISLHVGTIGLVLPKLMVLS